MTTLKSLVDETTNIKNEIVECRDTLKQILIDKKIEGLGNEDRLSVLIDKVNAFSDFEDRLYLYKNGNEYTNVTGGWILSKCKNGYAKFSKETKYLNLYTTRTTLDRISIRATNKIDLSKYTKLFVSGFAKHNTTSNDIAPTIFIGTTPTMTTDDSSYVKAKSGVSYTNKSDIFVIALDITSINSTEYVFFESFIGGDASAYSYVYEVWLTK